jgi:alpha-beta hydrolase superfamily lysophospholipase
MAEAAPAAYTVRMNSNAEPRPIASSLVTGDGLRLHGQAWPLPGARGSVVIVHGLGEHIGRHAALALQLNAWGWQVVGFDHRGHGRSEGPRGGLAQADDLPRDLAQVIDAARAAWPGPLVLLGHSMGGLVAARFVAEGLKPEPSAWYRAVDALVLSSPALDLGMNAGQKLLLGVLNRLAPGLAVGNGLNPAWISHDPAVVAAYVADPLVHDRITSRLVRSMLAGGALVHSLAPCWKLPTLLLWAGSDSCVAPAGSEAFAAAAPAGTVRAQCFTPLFHEIFNEPEKDSVFAALGSWLAERGQWAAADRAPTPAPT